MAGQDLVPAFVGDHRFEREIVRVGVPLKRLCINGQQIRLCRTAATVLGAARLAVDVTILDTAYKSELPGNMSRSTVAGMLLASA